MARQVVSYAVDADTVVRFEVDPSEEFRDVAADQVLGKVHEAVGPAVAAAQAVLKRVAEVRPDEVEVKFGVKVDGTANWLVARASTEASFEITLTWKPAHPTGGETGEADAAAQE